MNKKAFMTPQNKLRRAQWWLRWREGGGSHLWHARPLKDLRNDEQLKDYREIELLRRHTPYGKRVVNLNAWRFERVRQESYKRMVMA